MLNFKFLKGLSLIKITYIISFLGIFFDQLTKYYARLYLVNESFQFGFLRFDLVYNTGAAYGYLSNYTKPLLIIGVLVIIYLVYSMKSLIESKLTVLAYGSIFAGACGNTLDRLISGKVTDFINIQVIPVFNIADVLLNLGIIFIILDYFVQRKINEN